MNWDFLRFLSRACPALDVIIQPESSFLSPKISFSYCLLNKTNHGMSLSLING
jgi:hypothetical protein